MTHSIFYVMPTYQNNPLFLAKVANNLINSYERHLKKQNCTLSPAPSFEFNEPSELDKLTIDSKNDF